MKRALFAAALLLTPLPTLAQQAVPPAPYAYTQIADPAKERAAHDLMATLRCLVCQGQSLIDSDAALAGDMRHEVRSRIAAGESPDAVRAWLIQRYGLWVTYEPPLTPATALLYAAPLLALGGGLLIALRRFRRRRGERAA